MKKLNQLLIVEADPALDSLAGDYQTLLAQFSETPVGVLSLQQISRASLRQSPQLLLLHTNLTSLQHLQNFIGLQTSYPYSSIIIVGAEHDEELCLLALEAGADDSIHAAQLTPAYLRKLVLLSQRRYTTEVELRQSHEQLRACLQNTPNVAIQWYNNKGEVLYWNAASERIFGWPAKEAVGRKIDDLIMMPQNKDYWRHKIQHLTEAQPTYGPEEWSFQYRDGSEGCCISTLAALPSFGTDRLFVCMDVEITDRKQMEKALRESEEKYHNLFNQASDAIFINDANGKLLDVNYRACELLGYSKEQLLTKQVADLYSAEELARRPIMVRELEEGQRTFVERNILRANGHVLAVEVTGQQLNDGRIMAIIRDVSERKRAAEAVERSRRQLELIYNGISDVVFLLDVEPGPRFRFASANQPFFFVTGLTPAQVVGQLVEDVIPQPSLDLVLCHYARAMATGKPVTWEEVTGYPTGEKTGIVTVTPIFNKEGQCTQLVGTVSDITDRKKAEKAVLQSEEKYRSLIEQQADAITIFDDKGKIIDVNTSASTMLQYSKEELKKMTLADVLFKEEMKTNPVDFSLLVTGTSTIKQRKMQRKDGSVVETEVNAKRLYDHLFLASVRDLSERIEAQQRIQKESELSDSIINSLPGVFWLYQPGAGYLRWNRLFETITGYSGSELRHMLPSDFLPEEERASIEEAIKVVFEKGENSVEANFLTKAGKKIPYYFTGRYIDYAGKPAFLGTGIDLSEVKKLEARLSKQKVVEQKRIIQAMIEAEEKEKSKLGLELHDNVNQILSVVRMYLTILASDDQLEEVTLDKTVKLLDNAIHEIRHLSHSLAIGYKFEAGLVTALEDLVEKVQLSRDFSIQLSLSPQLDKSTSSQQKLAIYRIVQEQLNNIIKHAAASAVDIRLDIAEHELHLCIADNGKGFDLSKTKKGLGLSTMINRAEALGGKATVFSEPGKGYRLDVLLPLEKSNPGESV